MIRYKQSEGEINIREDQILNSIPYLIIILQKSSEMKKEDIQPLVKKQGRSQSIYQSSQAKENVQEGSKRFKKWTQEENRKYAKFLLENKEQFQDHKERRSLYFFNRMADQLNIGRDNLHCRSHHQKMLLRYKTISGVISGILGERDQNQEKPEETKKIQVLNQQHPIVRPFMPSFVPYFWFFCPQ